MNSAQLKIPLHLGPGFILKGIRICSPIPVFLPPSPSDTLSTPLKVKR